MHPLAKYAPDVLARSARKDMHGLGDWQGAVKCTQPRADRIDSNTLLEREKRRVVLKN
jgi:hypothetical protein